MPQVRIDAFSKIFFQIDRQILRQPDMDGKSQVLFRYTDVLYLRLIQQISTVMPFESAWKHIKELSGSSHRVSLF